MSCASRGKDQPTHVRDIGHITELSKNNPGISVIWIHPEPAPFQTKPRDPVWQVRQCFPLQLDQQDLLTWSHPQLLFTEKFWFLITAETAFPALADCKGRMCWGAEEAQLTDATQPTPRQTPTLPQRCPQRASLSFKCRAAFSGGS